jgi:Secretion system C-terminal sorting domain
VSGADTYSWWPADSVPCVDCAIMDVTPGGSTSYFVTGTNADGCTATVSFEVKVEICNSVVQLTNEDILVYPNPASEQIWIDWQEINTQSCIFSLVDMKGRVIQEEHLIAGNHIYMITLYNIPSGNYMYTLVSDKYQKTGTIVIE